MGQFTTIPLDTFQAMQMDAGIVLKKFDPAKPTDFKRSDIVTATTGGVQITAQPTYSDLGEDVDNCPVNTKDLKHLDSWACTMGFTGLGTSKEHIRMSLGAADIDADTGAIVPRSHLEQTDFEDSVWWVGDRADGGCIAACLKNVLSTDGFSLQTTKNGKGQVSITLTGHVTMENPDEIPIVIYSIDPVKTTAEEQTSNTSGAKANTTKTN